MSVPALLLFSTNGKSHITGIDWLAIALYFGILLGVAWWVVRKGKDTAADYFLAGRNLGWWIIGASIFASNIGSEHIVGLAGSGATSGVAMAHYELHAWCLLVLAWVFVPFYTRSHGVHDAGVPRTAVLRASRYVLSIVSLITFIVSKIAVGIFAGGVVFAHAPARRCALIDRRASIDSFWIGSVLVIVLTGLYTTLGGMRAVAYNDAVQVIVLIVGSALLTIYGLVTAGRLERAAALLRLRHVQPLEAADARRRRGHLGARAGDERRGSRSSARPGTSTATSPGWACCSARRSSACGTGAPTSTSCSARWARPTSRRPAAAASSPPF